LNRTSFFPNLSSSSSHRSGRGAAETGPHFVHAERRPTNNIDWRRALAIRAPLFELSTNNCTSRFRFPASAENLQEDFALRLNKALRLPRATFSLEVPAVRTKVSQTPAIVAASPGVISPLASAVVTGLIARATFYGDGSSIFRRCRRPRATAEST
jgi:hypothetical protein